MASVSSDSPGSSDSEGGTAANLLVLATAAVGAERVILYEKVPKNANPGLDVVKPLPIEEKEEEASALMRLDNEPNPNYFHQTHQLPINPNTKLSDANMLKAGIEFEMAMSKQGRLKQQCPDLKTIINSNFRLDAVRYTTADGPFKEYIAAYNYQHLEDSGLNDSQNRKIQLNQSSINTIKYYHCIAHKLSFPMWTPRLQDCFGKPERGSGH